MVKRNYLVLVLLVVVFAAPGLVAYLVFNHPHWLGGATTNNGKLLNPPELLTNLNSKPKWRLILWNPGLCDTACRHDLDTLGRIRLGLGRRLYEVDEWLVSASQPEAFSARFKQSLRDQDIHLLLLSEEEHAQRPALTNHPQVFIANPHDYLILSYAVNTKPEAIFHDLQQLLRAPKQKGG